VAHSHGGNVAIQALRLAYRSVSGVICLNTPFLHSRRRPFWFLQLLGVFPYTPVVLPAFVIGLYLYFTRYQQMYPGQYMWPVWLSTVWGSLWVPVGLLFVNPYTRLIERLERYLDVISDRVEDLLLPDAVPRVPVLVLTVPGDEAYWWLRLVDTVGVVVWLPLHAALGTLAVASLAIGLTDVSTRRSRP
jgi:hypothetical protein